MKDFFKELFEYNHQTNQKLITALVERADKISEKGHTLMSHVLNAHEVWNSRVEKTTPLYGVWQKHEPGAWLAINQANTERTMEILERADMDQPMAYKTSQGYPFEHKVSEIFFHVINHSTHHRGQIISDMKQHGFEPFISDYIFYKR